MIKFIWMVSVVAAFNHVEVKGNNGKEPWVKVGVVLKNEFPQDGTFIIEMPKIGGDSMVS